jgi:hypothetical protein
MLWFDASTITAIILAEHYILATVMIAIFAYSLVTQILGGSRRKLKTEVTKTLARGIPACELLLLMRSERGVEAFFSLGLTSYAAAFILVSPLLFLNGFASMCIASWCLGTHLYESVDLPSLTDEGA